MLVAFTQAVIAPSVPADTAGETEMVTWAVRWVQGGRPVTVYTYVPGGSEAGLKNGLTSAPFRVQAPPLSGEPPSRVMRGTAGSLVQKAAAALVPAFTAGFSTTVTEAESDTQGASPSRRYQYVPGCDTPGS